MVLNTSHIRRMVSSLVHAVSFMRILYVKCYVMNSRPVVLFLKMDLIPGWRWGEVWLYNVMVQPLCSFANFFPLISPVAVNVYWYTSHTLLFSKGSVTWYDNEAFDTSEQFRVSCHNLICHTSMKDHSQRKSNDFLLQNMSLIPVHEERQ